MSMPFYVPPEQVMKDRADFARKGIARGRSVIVSDTTAASPSSPRTRRAPCTRCPRSTTASPSRRSVVGVAAQVGVAHPGHPQVLELVVLADRGEGDPVVDLGDLVQRPARVLADEGDAVVVGEHHDRPSAGDPLAREVGPVLHQLLGRDVERHASSGTSRVVDAGGDDGVDHRRDLVVGHEPRAVGVDDADGRPDAAPHIGATGGGVVVGGVVERLDGDAHGLSSAARRQSFFSEPRANSEPDPTLWWSCSS